LVEQDKIKLVNVNNEAIIVEEEKKEVPENIEDSIEEESLIELNNIENQEENHDE
jgi:hypothetical protein